MRADEREQSWVEGPFSPVGSAAVRNVWHLTHASRASSINSSSFSSKDSMTVAASPEKAIKEVQQPGLLSFLWFPSNKPQPGQPTWGHFARTWRIPLIVLYYSVCSSTLIVINKVAVHNIRAPVFILGAQLLFAAFVVKALAVCRVLEAEPLQWRLVRPFLLVVLGFLGTVYANIKVLEHSNVETFITFRSSTPLLLSIFDYMFLGRKLPGGRSIFSIFMLVASCSGYTYFDQGFKMQAYFWLCVW